MKRREFLVATAGSAGALGLSPLTGCRTPHAHAGDAFDPGPYEVGERRLIFDERGAAWELDVSGHALLKLDDSGSVVARISSLGEGEGELNHPTDALVAGDRVYVLDRGNGKIEVFAADGRPAGRFGDCGVAGRLAMPRDFALFDGEIYVCNSHEHRIEVFDLDGHFRRTFGAASPGDRRGLNGPLGVAVRANGEVHVLDAGDAQVHVFSTDGRALAAYGDFGEDPGQMLYARSITIGREGHVYVADPAAGRIHVFDATGRFLGRFQPMDASGRPVPPYRVSVRPDGSLYVWTAGGETFVRT